MNHSLSAWAFGSAAADERSDAAERGVGAFRKLDIEEVLAWRPDAIVLSGASEAGAPAWISQLPGVERISRWMLGSKGNAERYLPMTSRLPYANQSFGICPHWPRAIGSAVVSLSVES